MPKSCSLRASMATRNRRSARILSDGPPAEPQPQPQERRPVRRVLLVERDVTAIVVRGSGRRFRRSAALVHDRGCRCEENAATPGTERRAEVDVFFVEEEPLVEQPGGHRGLAP